MTDLRSEIDYLHSILELLAEIRDGLGRIEDRLPNTFLEYQKKLLKNKGKLEVMKGTQQRIVCAHHPMDECPNCR